MKTVSMEQPPASPEAERTDRRSMQIVAFDVGGTRLGIDIQQVSYLVRMVEITPVPGAPDQIEGVIDVRGQVVPVISLHRLFGCARRGNLLDMYILVGETSSNPIGLTVESMSDLYDVGCYQLDQPDETQHLAELMSAFARLDDGIVFMLDLDKIASLASTLDYQPPAGVEDRIALEEISAEVRAVLRERAAALRQVAAEEDVAFKRFVTFELGNENYAIDGSRIQKVTRVPDIVPVPGTADHFAGLMNFAGEILWVVDVKKLLGLPVTLAGNDERVVVLKNAQAKLGFLADAVFDVLNVPTSAIRPAMEAAKKSKDNYVPEEICWHDELIGILDLSGLCEE